MIYIIGYKNNTFDTWSYSVLCSFDDAARQYGYYQNYADRCLYRVDLEKGVIIKL